LLLFAGDLPMGGIEQIEPTVPSGYGNPFSVKGHGSSRNRDTKVALVGSFSSWKPEGREPSLVTHSNKLASRGNEKPRPVGEADREALPTRTLRRFGHELAIFKHRCYQVTI